MDLSRRRARMVLRWRAHHGAHLHRPLATSVPGCDAPKADRPPISRRCSAPTGRARTGPPISSSMTRRWPRTSRRRRSWPRCAPRPLRPAAAVRAVAAPDRRQQGNRCGPSPYAAARGGAASGSAPERPRAPGSRHPRCARCAAARAAGRGRAPPPAGLYPWRDRPAAGAAAGHCQLTSAARAGCDAARAGGDALKELLERVGVPEAEAAGERAREVVLAAFTQREPAPEVRPSASFVLVLAPRCRGGARRGQPAREGRDRPRSRGGRRGARADRPLLTARSREAARRLGWRAVGRAAGWLAAPVGRLPRASWSPFGRFVVATRANELAALEPDGDVRWTLARPAATDPAWAGTRSDTRIAYADRSGIRLVAGDGTGDRLLIRPAQARSRGGPAARASSRSCRPAGCVSSTSTPAVSSGGRGPACGSRARARVVERRKAVARAPPTSLRVYDDRGRVTARDDPSDSTQDADAAFRPGTHEVAVIRLHGAQSTVFRLATGDPLFNGTGTFDQVTWSPDGRRLLVTWPTADQWVFVPARGPRRVEAVANVSAQFRSPAFPRVEGWCCER